MSETPTTPYMGRKRKAEAKAKYVCIICSYGNDSLMPFLNCTTCSKMFICTKCACDQHISQQHQVESMETMNVTRKARMDELKQTVDISEVSSIGKGIQRELMKAHDAVENISSVLQSHILPTFDMAVAEEETRCESALAKLNPSATNVFDNARFEATLADVPMVVQGSKRKQQRLKSEMDKLSAAINGANAAVNELAAMTTDGDLKPFDGPKTRGIFRFKCDLSTLEVGKSIESEALVLGGFTWKVIVRHSVDTRGKQWFGLYLECKGRDEWSCKAKSTLSVLSRKEGVEDMEYRFVSSFTNCTFRRGWEDVFPWNDIMNEELGFVKNGKAIVKADIDIRESA